MDKSITQDGMTAADCYDVLHLADSQVTKNTIAEAKNLLNISLLGRENIKMKTRIWRDLIILGINPFSL